MKKILFISLAVILALSMGLIGCTPEEGEGEGEGEAIPYKNDGIFVDQTIGLPECLDPAWGYDTASGEQLDYIYETLLWWDGTSSSEFDPVLATAWSYNETDDTWHFTIREGVTFQEGGTLTPEDVEYSFERALVQDRAGGPIWMFYELLLGVGGYGDVTFTDIDEAVEVDGDDVVFTLSSAAYRNPWLQVLTGPWSSIVDMEWCVLNGEWDGEEGTADSYNDPLSGTSYLWDEANGTGPWELQEWDPGVDVTLVEFDGYWGTAPPFHTIITQQVEEWTTRKLAILNGDADHIYVPRQYMNELEGISDLNVITDLAELVGTCIFFNFDIDPASDWIGSGALDGNGIPTDFFSDLDVRLGFTKAFDWETYITDVYMDEATQVGSPIVEGLTYFNPAASMHSFCLTAAETHLQAAWGGALWTNGMKFTILYNAGNDQRKSAVEILKDNLFSINPLFQISILPLDWSTGIVPELVTHRLSCFMIGWQADYPDPDNFVYPFMHSLGTFSFFAGYNSTAADALIDTGRYSGDPGTRQTAYYALQELYYTDAPGIMVVQPLGRRYFTKYISGFYFNPMIPGNPGPLQFMSKSES